MLAAYYQQQLMAPLTGEGSCKRLVFETWLKSRIGQDLSSTGSRRDVMESIPKDVVS
ncbi:MAG TPA: hypothetical protein V6C85_05560 [Allocoleopsis sp.]